MQSYEARLTLGGQKNPINPALFGHFIEFMYDCIDEGMWAQLLLCRGFEDANAKGDGLPALWQVDGEIDVARVTLDSGRSKGPGHSLKIETINHYGGWRGAWQGGLLLEEKETYEGYLWASGNGTFEVALCGDEEEVLFSQPFTNVGDDWTQHSFCYKSASRQTNARFMLRMRGEGTLWFDQCSLMPKSRVAGVWKAVMARIRALNPPVIRYPGGCFADTYHWRDGIGPIDERPARPNTHWGGMVDNSMGTDEYIEFCRATGCEPYICVNMGSGSVQEACDWLEYCNGGTDTKFGALRAAGGHPEPYNVKLWDIGNEIFGEWEVGHMPAEEYARQFLGYYDAMKAVDPGITIVACGGDGNKTDQSWNRALCELLGDKLDMLSLHFYSPHLEFEKHANVDIYEAVVGSPQFYAGVLAETKALLAEYYPSGKQPPVAVTEWNTSYQNEMLREHTLEAALFNAGLLNLFLRESEAVQMCNYSDLVNGWPGGCIRSARGEAWGTASYHLLCMYAGAAPATLLESHFTSPTYNVDVQVGHLAPAEGRTWFDAVAAQNEAGHTLLFLLNRHPQQAAEISLEGIDLPSEAELQSLNSENTWDMNHKNDETVRVQIERVSLALGKVMLSPHSANLLIL